MTLPVLLSRRFIRLQAVQRLYAFYVCRQANHGRALDQIRADFIPDVFADPPVDSTQSAQALQKAIDLFETSLAMPDPLSSGSSLAKDRISSIVSRAVTSYRDAMARDKHRLEQGFVEAITVINQSCVRIWQLLVEWMYLDEGRNEVAGLGDSSSSTASVGLADSVLLKRLGDDECLADLVQQWAASWELHMPLVKSWYHQFIRRDTTIRSLLAALSHPNQELPLLVYLVERIIFGKEGIHSFFDAVDVRWTAHKCVVKKLVRRGLARLGASGDGKVDMELLEPDDPSVSEQCFYTALVRMALQRDRELDGMIAQTAENWAIDRVLLLDKTIIKLALCEMLYFADIPIKVSINEYIDLSKMYSMPKSSQFVNGLLDAVASKLRP